MDKATEQRTAALRIPEDLFIAGQPFTGNELMAMVSRGLLRETLPGHFLELRLAYTPAMRAQIAGYVAGHQLHPNEVFCRSIAAWVHGLLPYCTTLNIASGQYRRPVAPNSGISFEFSQFMPPPEEVLQHGQVQVTNLLRTVCDMACHAPLPLAVQALQHCLALQDPFLDLAGIAQRLRLYPPGSPVQRGLRLLDSMQSQAA